MTQLAHGGGHVEGTPGEYVGSLLYDVAPEHVPALAALLVVPAAAWLVHARPQWLPSSPRLARLRTLPAERVLAVWLLWTSALVHVLVVPAHGISLWALAFGADAALLATAADRLVTGRRRAGGFAALVLAGSLLGLLVDLAARHVPDQVAMATKLVEVTALVALGAPLAAGRVRRVVATAAVTAVATVVAAGTWAAALDGFGGPSVTVAMPVPADDPGEPSLAQEAAADDLYRRTLASLARYADPAAAVAAGYAADGVRGTDFHADNPRFVADGRTLDPERPETLVYAVRDDGSPVLLGAMYQAKGLRTHGPTPGGTLTTWHAHEQVCFGVLPPALAGVTSPFGVCPAGSVTVPLTNEMIHVWTVPGAPQRFGDLDQAWLKAHVLELPTAPAAARAAQDAAT